LLRFIPREPDSFDWRARSFCKPRVMEDERWEISKSSLARLFLPQSAVDAVKNWRYEPFQLDGNPVK